MTDRYRFSKRARELNERASLVDAKMERALKDETRMRIILAALTGAALNDTGSDKLGHEIKIAGRVANALDLADEVLRRITETT